MKKIFSLSMDNGRWSGQNVNALAGKTMLHGIGKA